MAEIFSKKFAKIKYFLTVATPIFSTLPLSLISTFALEIKTFYYFIIFLKGTVSVISIDPPSKDGNALFTTVTLKPLNDQECRRCCRFSRFKTVLF